MEQGEGVLVRFGFLRLAMTAVAFFRTDHIQVGNGVKDNAIVKPLPSFEVRFLNVMVV